MNFILATLVWLIIGAVLGVGIWLVAAKAMLWPFALATFVIVVWVSWVGYAHN